MRFSVEPWAPEYGVPAEGDPEEGPPARVDAELPPGEWRPLLPEVEPAETVLFVDGVRRIDASLWIEAADDQPPELGLCAVYAAGAVRCDGRAEVVAAEVRRGLFTSAPGAQDVVTAAGSYPVRATSASAPERMWAAIQDEMGMLEGEVAAGVDADLMVLDGPLSARRHVKGAVGYVKTQHRHYLPEGLRGILTALPVGRRTPLFVTATTWERWSWYLRLAAGVGPAGGLVRCEIAPGHEVGEAARIADRVTATLPRFASDPHKDPRAPQNLYPIGGLERELRRRLGDQRLMLRALQAATAT